MENKIALVAEDTTKDFQMFEKYLNNMGLYVDRANDGDEAFQMMKRGSYAVVILDIKMPKKDGQEVLRQIRRLKPNLPIIMVSEHVGPAVEAECLNMKASDFIPKRFHEASFQARVRRVIDMHTLINSSDELSWGSVKVVTTNKTAYYNGQKVDLTEKEFDILLPLVKARGDNVDPDVLELAGWGDVKPYSSRLATKMTHIRDRFEEQGAPRDIIDTTRGLGYVLGEG